MIVRVNAAPQYARRQRSDHFIGVHIAAGAGTGLENVEREMGVVCAVGDFGAGALNGRSHLRVHLRQIQIDSRSRPFDQPDGADKLSRETQWADGKVVNRSLGLGSV